jgi:sucrose phosphorylase
VRIVRLDAVGYVIKKPGTTCFMVEPEIYDFLDWVTETAASLGLAVLPEVHDRYQTHERLTAHGYWTYDFVLPGLVLDAFVRGDPRRLARHLSRSPHRQFTLLDCHDGIPVRPDLDGILEPPEMRALVDHVVSRGGNVTRILSDAHAEGGDIHQLNCTYFSALDHDTDRFVAARAIQLFARGIPQVNYVGLLAGTNDLAGVERTGDGRAINRHDFAADEIGEALGRPVVRRIVDLVRLRNTHPAFEGELEVDVDGDCLQLAWMHDGTSLSLEVDLVGGSAVICDAAGAPSAI